MPVESLEHSFSFYDAVLAAIGLHISLQTPSRSAVVTFYQTAPEQGDKDAGRTGERPQYSQPFYGALRIDREGFKIDTICRSELLV